jgi:GDP/UDP-N,N'-diacetylbacillosamine 2-epimerase (hydrolysing)
MRRACFVTATRAEYGLLRPLHRALQQAPEFEPLLVVTGTHLAAEYGRTVAAIEADGVKVDERIDMLVAGDSPAAAAKSLGLLIIGLADVLRRMQPDFVVLLGDRYELVGAAMAAALFGVPVVHLHGGEITEGASDDAYRHAVTKLSSLHLTATEAYRRRVIQLGEPPETVHAVGAIGLDALRGFVPITRQELCADVGLDPDRPFVLVTYHPVTAALSDAEAEIDLLLECVLGRDGLQALVTFANADVGGGAINRRLHDWSARHPASIVATPSLGQRRYLSAMVHSEAVVGNSSSGIIEAPSAGVGTLDIGPRQAGRVRARSVSWCEPTREGIREGLATVLAPEFRAAAQSVDNPYGDGRTVDRIVDILSTWRSNECKGKRFYDTPWVTAGTAGF